jgi:DNA-binding response OmpR family regulator
LKTQGFTVLEARNGSHALDVANEHAAPIHIVISDIVMPGQMNGVDLGREIRRRFGDDFPLLLVTGYSERAAEAIESGFRLLRKPYSLAELHAALLLVKRQ